jgi:hypothetical protein
MCLSIHHGGIQRLRKCTLLQKAFPHLARLRMPKRETFFRQGVQTCMDCRRCKKEGYIEWHYPCARTIILGLWGILRSLVK